jgi:Response regulator containing a CheY-like receiver domain and an HTH DNA-binding domain
MASLGVLGEGFTRWCSSAKEVSVFSDGLFDRLATQIPFEGAFLAAVDPATLLYTRAFRRGMPPEASRAFIETEFGVDDVNQLRRLVRAPSPVGWLDQATHGDRMAARRYRHAMHPYGLGDELRVALLSDGICWGLLCLHRAHARAGFDLRDATLLARIAPAIAGALRQALVSGQAMSNHAWDGPGVAVFNADSTLHSSTPGAARWLDDLANLDRPQRADLPTVVAAVIERLTSPGQPNLEPARARVRTPSGRWLTVHASHLDDGQGSIAVVIEPTSPAALSPLIIAAFGLTDREGDIAQRLLAGLARKAIASELHISLHTVNDHVKAVYDKTGVSSAGQLRAHVFDHHAAGPSPTH